MNQGQATDAKLKMISRRETDEKQIAARLEALVDQGDSLMEKEQFDVALKYFQRARLLDPDNEIVSKKLGRCDSINQAIISVKLIQDERSARIAQLRALAIKSYQDHYLEVSKSTIDSLVVHYEVDDTEIKSISGKLSKVIPFISQMTIIEQGKDYELGLDYSTRIVRSAEKNPQEVDSLLASEALYWSGRMYYNLDSMKSEDAAAYFKEALAFSSNNHLPARILLVKSKLYQKKKKLEALELATSMVDTEPRNADLRALRAYVYEYLQDYENALKEYQLAIQLKTAYPSVYTSKARLEMQLGRNTTAASTAAAGLEVYPCDLDLIYTRIAALQQAGLFKEAGISFQQAEACGLRGEYRDQLLGSSMSYYKKGIGFLVTGDTDSAVFYFTRSFDLTQSKEALFKRGETFYRLGFLDKALDDLNRLIQLDTSFSNAYYLRGRIKSDQGNHESAINDYKNQLEISPGGWETYAAYGISEFALADFPMAAAYFERSNRLEYKDSVGYMAVAALYRSGSFNKGIELAKDYRSKYKSESASVFKYQGMCEFQIRQYKAAENNLSESLKQLPQDFEANYFLSRTLLSLGEQEKSFRFAEKAALLCNDCPEAVVWKSVASFSLTKSSWSTAPEQMMVAFRKDTSLKTAANQAWLAYGLLRSGREASQYSTWLLSAKESDSEDPIVNFVQACVLADGSSDGALVTSLLTKACVNGYAYPSFLETDPGLLKYKSTQDMKALRQKYFKD
ncbi:MAG: tetratricopeptide repeat protein, partial [Bacteroidota bacterium]